VRESPHVSDDQLARRDARTPGLAAALRTEPRGVDATAPAAQPVHAEILKLPERRGGRREGERGPPVQSCDVAADESRGLRHPVLLGVRDDVGLVHGDRRDAQRIGRGDALPAEHERRREVHDIGPELAQDRGQAGRPREHHTHVGIRRQRHRSQQLGARTVQVGRDLAGARRDHEGLVAFGGEVTQDVEHRPRHPVHVGQERFGEQCDSHDPSVMG